MSFVFRLRLASNHNSPLCAFNRNLKKHHIFQRSFHDTKTNHNHKHNFTGSCCRYSAFTHQIAHQRQQQQQQQQAHTLPDKSLESAFNLNDVIAIETNNIRFGLNALAEVGAAATSYGAKRVLIFTDRLVRKQSFFETVIQSVVECGLSYVVYDEVEVEPTNLSFMHAIQFATENKCDAFISVGGGSVIDTAKAANLYSSNPSHYVDFLDFVNKPIGRQKFDQIGLKIKPHIACPTTAGTGSESTGISIFDHVSLRVKTGIAQKLIRPTIAIVDPIVTHSLKPTVCVSSAFDVLCHALESYTAINHRAKPAPASARERFLQRPLSQGRNRWSDLGAMEAIRIIGQNLLRAVDGHDLEARENLMYASLLAGIAFGNSGVHLPHAMSYAVAGNVSSYVAPDYELSNGPIIPHGMAVVLNAPAVFEFTAASSVSRHYEACLALGGASSVSGCSPTSVDQVSDAMRRVLTTLMKETGVPNGLSGVGYSSSDIPTLSAGTLVQRRLLDNCPVNVTDSQVEQIFKRAMTYW